LGGLSGEHIVSISQVHVLAHAHSHTQRAGGGESHSWVVQGGRREGAAGYLGLHAVCGFICRLTIVLFPHLNQRSPKIVQITVSV